MSRKSPSGAPKYAPSRKPRASLAELKEHARQIEANKQSPLVAFISKHRKATALAVALLVGGAYVLPSGTTDNKSKMNIATGVKENTDNQNKFTIDGFEITSKSVPEAKFREAYQQAKAITGGLHWKPQKLSVEYGDVSKTHFGDNPAMLEPGSKASFTNDNLDQIISHPEHLPHELIHFLLGPDARKWPVVLQEVISGAVDVPENVFRDKDLNQPWVQMPVEMSMYNGPLAGFRYAAMQSVGRQHSQKWPTVIKAALQRHDLNFDNVSAFLGQFGISHKILERGTSGENMAFVPFSDSEKKGYLFISYARNSGQADEFGWRGVVRINFFDNLGQRYEMGNPIPMEGVVFIPPPMLHGSAQKFTSVKIENQQGGTYTQNLE